MHDQRKVKEEIDEKTKLANEEKIRQFRTIYDDVFQQYRSNNLSRDVLGLLNVLLEVSPEQYTFFGYRRRILTASWAAAAADGQGASEAATAPQTVGGPDAANQGAPPHEEAISPPTAAAHRPTASVEANANAVAAAAKALKAADLESEYVINTKVILKDYKVYSAFVHRRWILCEMPSAARRVELLRGELKKCDGLLKMDERNFHAWGYRRWVTKKLAVDGQYADNQEWAFTEAKIRDNFSNYSAWHNRAMLMESLHRNSSMIKASLSSSPTSASDTFFTTSKSEMDLAVRAFYCDPNDQSAWLYAEFLLGLLRRACTHGNAADGDTTDSVAEETYAAVLAQVVNSCDELLQEEDLPFALWMRSVIVRSHAPNPKTMRLPSDVVEAMHRWGDLAALSTRLQAVDGLRAGMYAHLLAPPQTEQQR